MKNRIKKYFNVILLISVILITNYSVTVNAGEELIENLEKSNQRTEIIIEQPKNETEQIANATQEIVNEDDKNNEESNLKTETVIEKTESETEQIVNATPEVGNEDNKNNEESNLKTETVIEKTESETEQIANADDKNDEEGNLGIEVVAEDNTQELVSIGDKKYTDIRNAVAEVKTGETIVLLGDIYVKYINPDDHDQYYVADLPDNVTLDLNGHVLNNDYMSFILQGNNLTIKNGIIKAPEGISYALYIGDEREGGTSGVIVQNVTIDGGINVFNCTNVKIRNSNVTGRDYYAVWADINAQIIIESGTYTKVTDQNKVEALLGLATVEKDVPESAIIIKGGNFINPYKVFSLQSTETVKRYQPVIYGGTFNNDVEQYLVKNISMIQNPNGEYIVGYKIEVSNNNNVGGTISVEDSVVAAGKRVEVKYQENKDYKLNSIVVIDSKGNAITVNSDNTFIMPESDVTISATFTKSSTDEKTPIIDETKDEEKVLAAEKVEPKIEQQSNEALVNVATGSNITINITILIIAILGICALIINKKICNLEKH